MPSAQMGLVATLRIDQRVSESKLFAGHRFLAKLCAGSGRAVPFGAF